MIPNTPAVQNLHWFVKSVRTSNCNDSAAMAVLGMFRALLSLQYPPIASNDELSARFLYYNLTEDAGSPGQDVGSSVSAAIQSLKTIGVCPEDLWHYANPLSTQPPPEIYSASQGNKIRQSHVVPQDLDSLVQCLLTAHPFACEIDVYPSTFSAEVAKSGNVPMPSAAEVAAGPIGKECLYCIGYNQGPTFTYADAKPFSENSFLCQLARGPSFGFSVMSGCVAIPFDYLTGTMARDFATIDAEV